MRLVRGLLSWPKRRIDKLCVERGFASRRSWNSFDSNASVASPFAQGSPASPSQQNPDWESPMMDPSVDSSVDPASLGVESASASRFAAVDANASSSISPSVSTGLEWFSETDLHGLSSTPFSDDIAKKLLAPIDDNDVEIKPDGIIYLPEIKYRRVLLSAFGPGGWGIIPRTPFIERNGFVVAEFALYAQGRLISTAWGEHNLSNGVGRSLGTALEAARSMALMRCCKDIGIASELWETEFIERWKSERAVEAWCEHAKTGDKRKLWRRRDRPPFTYPFRENDSSSSGSTSSSGGSRFRSSTNLGGFS